MKTTWFSDGLFAVLAVCAAVQLGFGVHALSRSTTWQTIAVARATLTDLIAHRS